MKRSTALKTMLLGAGGIASLKRSGQAHAQAGKNAVRDTVYKPDRRALNGNPPVATTTPWGQHVQHDLSTYKEMQKYSQLTSLDQNWTTSQVDRSIDAKAASGELVIENPPTRLLTGVWALTGDGQQRMYLIDTGEGLLLVDPSYDAFTEKLLRQVEKLGYTADDIRWVLLTHCHVDHAQSTPYWQQNGKEIFIHSGDLNPIRTGNEITAWWLLTDTRGYFNPVSGPVTTFEDGDMLRFGGLELWVIHTPGHTPGSSCFYFARDGKHVLLSEDIILHFGRHAWMGTPFSDWEQYLRSLWKVRRFAVWGRGEPYNPRKPIDYDLVLPGHGTIALDLGTREVDFTIQVVSEIINRRLAGEGIDWIDPYRFFWERELKKAEPIKIQYR